MLVHRVAREFIVARLCPVGRAPVYEEYDRDRGITTHTVEELPIGIVAKLLRHLGPQVTNSPADALQFAEDIGVEPGATRITDLLFSLRDIEQGFRHAALSAEKINLEDDHIFPRGVEHVFEGRIGN